MVRITIEMHLTPGLDLSHNNQNQSSMVYAASGKNHGSKGQGSNGTNGGGATTQTRGQ
jgi:hypothetical protein